MSVPKHFDSDTLVTSDKFVVDCNTPLIFQSSCLFSVTTSGPVKPLNNNQPPASAEVPDVKGHLVKIVRFTTYT